MSRTRSSKAPLRAPTRGARPQGRAAGARRKGASRKPPTNRRVARKPQKAGFQPWRFLLKWSFITAIWGVIALIGVIAWFSTGLPDIAAVGAPDRRAAVTVLDSEGGQIARYGDLTGDYVRVGELPDHLIDAILAIEDRRFYSHLGVDPLGILRAGFANWRAGRVVQGGSTITQQLAKNLFLTADRTWGRKIEEAVLAVWLEMNFTKDEILSAYLNRVYLGAGAYGVDAAALAYFGVPARDLTLRQSAVIAGLLRAPSRLSPTSNPEGAEARADVVLAAMADARFITRAESEAADGVGPARAVADRDGRYFADWVSDQLPDFIGAAADVTIATTLDPALQDEAQRIVVRHLAAEGAGVGQAAAVIMDMDGAVRAMVGGRSYGASQFNRATQARRQPGSAFKPVVWLAALEAGWGPHSMVLDAPIARGGWAPENFGGGYQGEITLARALAESVNTAAVRLLENAGIDRTIALAERMGLSGPLRRDLSLALGTSEVSLLELTGAYAVLAARGEQVLPYGIRQIVARDGETLYRRQPGGAARAASPQAAEAVSAMLAQALREGTGRAAALPWSAAGKTGTSQDYRDAWFIGFSGDRVIGVWVGNDDGAPMPQVTGGGLPARIWRDLMLAAGERRSPTPLAVPPLGPAPIPIARDREGLDRMLEALPTGEPDALGALIESVSGG